MPRLTSKQIDSFRLESLDGVRDVEFKGGASYEKKARKNYTKADYDKRHADIEYSDRAARKKRYGVDW